MPYYPPASSGSGTPGGSSGDIQFNNSSSFDGARLSYSESSGDSIVQHTGSGALDLKATDSQPLRVRSDNGSATSVMSVDSDDGFDLSSTDGVNTSFHTIGPNFAYTESAEIGFADESASYYAILDPSGIDTSNKTFTLPNNSGTVALTSDVPTALTDLDTTVTGSQLNTLYSNTSGTNTGDQTTVSGNAGTATALQTARTIGSLTGDVTSAGSSFDGTANNTNSTTVTKINGTSLAGLATGILKNTTTTGVPSIAVAGDFPTLNQNTTGSAASLTTARTFRTNLASTSTASFNGTANVTPGVTGTLPVSNGGTGASTHTSGNYLKGNGTGAITSESAATLAATVGNLLFPVGALYTATVSTNPGTLLGFGTWAAYGEGRVLVGKAAAGTFATAGATGGEETHTLTAAESGLPAHNHTATQAQHRHSNGNHGTSGAGYGHVDSGSATSSGTFYTDYQTPAITVNNNTAASASSAHNNLQPYIVVYIWQRTA